MQKWISLTAGIILQVVLGSVYAWSVFAEPLYEGWGVSAGRSGLVFGVMIGVFTLAAIPAGRLLQRKGPKLTAGIGALLFGAGYIIASLSGGNFPLILAGIGVVSGVGIGFGYVCPLSVGMKWFPRRKGLITGIAVAGFGAGAILLSFLAEALFFARGAGALEVFGFIGVFYGGAAFVCALLMSEPGRKGAGRSEVLCCGIRPHLSSVKFRVLCLGMFAGTFAGLLVIGNLKPMMTSYGLDERLAVLSISIFAAGNVGGRIMWGGVHDRIGSRNTVLISLLVLAGAIFFSALRLPAEAALFTVFLVGIGFGGCFVVYASSVAELFGTELFPKLYPVCFLFYGLAALTGPPAGGFLFDASGSYTGGLIISMAVVLLSAAAISASNGRVRNPGPQN